DDRIDVSMRSDVEIRFPIVGNRLCEGTPEQSRLPTIGNRISTSLRMVTTIRPSWYAADLTWSTKVLMPFLQDQPSPLLASAAD
ncbi:MAG: hypothetical protein R6U98_28820, partial [Pirellulaceae bacterium]